MKNYCRLISLGLILSVFWSLVPFHQNVLAQPALPPYKNPGLPLEQRVDDLVSRMTLEEKVLQMQKSLPGNRRFMD